MNKRNQEIVSDEALVAHLKKNYIYDARRGVVVNRKLNRVVKGTVNKDGYVMTRLRIRGNHPSIQLHHMVWAVAYGRIPTQIDHINGDKTDNRLENLREVSQSENNKNTIHPWKPNARTGLPGVRQKSDGRIAITCHKDINFSDKYEAFHALVLLGRMFKSEDYV